MKPYSAGLGRLADALFPPLCALCGSRLDALEAPVATCRPCLDGLPWHARGAPRPCRVCGLDAGRGCACQKHRLATGAAWSWDRAHSGFWFAGPVASAIGRAKYQARGDAIRRLGEWTALALVAQLAERARADWPEMLVPVPLHRGRLFTRGYNQALELARPLARQTGLGLAPDAATRVRRTVGQARAKASEAHRFGSLAGAFVADPRRVAGRRVALFDDVHTTGATFEALARAVRSAGAATVEVWSVARVA